LIDTPSPYFNTRPRAAVVLDALILPLDRVFNRLYGSRYNPLYQSGTLAVLFLFTTIATGLYQLIFYKVALPYESVAGLEAQWWAGRWIRAVHTYSGDGMLLAVGVHALRMMLQGKTWGARVLAWISGMLMTGVVLLSAWTGIVLVWDAQAQVVGMEGARLMDTLPFFSEPMVRNFTLSTPPPGTFFFLNLLLHMVFPVGIVLMLYIHTLRVAKPGWLPPRPLMAWTLFTLIAAGILWPLGMMPKADPFQLPDRVHVDLLYTWWLKLNSQIPAGWHLALWGALGLAGFSAPWWWRPRNRMGFAPSVNNTEVCTGCTQCYLDCPYEAITMRPAPEGRTDTETVAEVDPSLCTSCGICAGSCAPMLIGPPGRAGRNLMIDVQRFQRAKKPGPEDIVVFTCMQGLATRLAGAELEGIHVYPAHCIGALHTSMFEYLLRRGTGGLYLIGCPERDCSYRRGLRWITERIYNDREAELKDRVDKKRVRVASFGAGELPEALAALQVFQLEIFDKAHHALDEGQVDLDAECETVLNEAGDD